MYIAQYEDAIHIQGHEAFTWLSDYKTKRWREERKTEKESMGNSSQMFSTEKATLALRRWDSTGRRLFFHLPCRVYISVMEIVGRYVKQLLWQSSPEGRS